MVPPANTHKLNTGGTHTFSKSQRCNTHWVPFHFVRRYFISVLLSPPAAHYLARRLPHFGCAQLVNANCSARTSHSQSITKLRLHSSAASVHFVKFTAAASYGAGIGLTSFGLYCQPLVGARSHLRYSSVAFGGSPPAALQRRQVCGARLSFFFAAGAFTGPADTQHLFPMFSNLPSFYIWIK
jgi:hypothetical protein